MSTTKHVYNLIIKRIPSLELKHKLLTTMKLPTSIDLRNKMPPVYDQGQLGSCTANALAACFEYEDNNAFIPSRLFIYYNERVIENNINTDSGACLYDGIKSIQKTGVCSENLWPYNISKFKIKPTKNCYTDAENYKALDVTNIQQDITSMKTSLANGYPFVVGISVYASFESKKVSNTGIVPMPDIHKEELLGGHAVLVCGYDDLNQRWILRNSWGSSWGDKGYFYLPYLYLLDSHLSSDLWNITKLNIVSPLKKNRIPTSNHTIIPLNKVIKIDSIPPVPCNSLESLESLDSLDSSKNKS